MAPPITCTHALPPWVHPAAIGSPYGRPAGSACAAAAAFTNLATVVILILFIFAICHCCTRWAARRRRDGFTSQRVQEVLQKSQEILDRTGGNVTYSEYKLNIPDTDPVAFTDIRTLWKEGPLTMEGVSSAL